MSLLSPFPSVSKQGGSWGFTVGGGSCSVLSLGQGSCQVSALSPGGAALLGTLGTLGAGVRLLDEPVHSPAPLNPRGVSGSSAGW